MMKASPCSLAQTWLLCGEVLGSTQYVTPLPRSNESDAAAALVTSFSAQCILRSVYLS